MPWMNEWTNECVSSVKAIRMICGLLFRTWLDSHKYSGPTQWCTPEEGTCWNFILFESHTKCSKQCQLRKKRSVTCNVSWVQWKCFTVGFPGYSLYVSKQADRMIGGSSGKKQWIPHIWPPQVIDACKKRSHFYCICSYWDCENMQL